jgi:hypothetical protein
MIFTVSLSHSISLLMMVLKPYRVVGSQSSDHKLEIFIGFKLRGFSAGNLNDRPDHRDIWTWITIILSNIGGIVSYL